jgi:predicted transposase/invertase (TIGR01784 family)
MQTITQSIGIRKAISIVENMNSIDSYKTLAEQREEALFNERLAMGASFRKGINEGAHQAKLEMAKSLFGVGMSLEQIADISKLPLSTIESLQTNS